MCIIKSKNDIPQFLEDVKREGNFSFNDSKNNYSEHTTQLTFDKDLNPEWTALLSSNLSISVDINDVEKWVWERRKDINNELKNGVFQIPKIKFSPTFGTKRIHFKGRGKTERPACPHCGEDLKRSYETAENWKKGKTPYGWHCRTCKYQQWD